MDDWLDATVFVLVMLALAVIALVVIDPSLVNGG